MEKAAEKIDMHVHSNASDGTFTPRELVDYAVKKGLKAFALTDHDTVAGLEEAIGSAQGSNIEVIPGIEFSTAYEGRDIHILGYDMDYRSDEFRDGLKALIESRDVRNMEMTELLVRNGFEKITYKALKEAFPDAVITRAHIARLMVSFGYAGDMREVFDRYIGEGCPFYVGRKRSTPKQAIELILTAGGIPVLAHPLLYGFTLSGLERAVKEFVTYGLCGIEAIYSMNTGAEEREMKRLALRNRLLITGGSDFHGSNKPHIDMGEGRGGLFVPYSCLEELRRLKRA